MDWCSWRVVTAPYAMCFHFSEAQARCRRSRRRRYGTNTSSIPLGIAKHDVMCGAWCLVLGREIKSNRSCWTHITARNVIDLFSYVSHSTSVVRGVTYIQAAHQNQGHTHSHVVGQASPAVLHAAERRKAALYHLVVYPSLRIRDEAHTTGIPFLNQPSRPGLREPSSPAPLW